MVVGDLALGDQAIADTHVRLDIARVRGVGLDLLAQRAHKDAQARQVALSCRTPNLVQDKLVRQHLVGVVRQQAQELVLDRRQMQFLAIHRGDAGIKINMQLTGIARTFGGNAARLRIRETPERRANACKQFLDRKRLGQVVIGAGIMGALHIRLAKMGGARVIVSELDPARMDVARKMGADIVINASEADPIAQVKELTEGRGADAVFCTVATSAVAKQAVDMAGKLGRVVMYTSFFPDLPIEISPTKLHSGEQILTGSVNPNPVDFLTATRLLSRKLIDVSSLISDRVPMAEIDRAFREAVEPNTYRIIVKP